MSSQFITPEGFRTELREALLAHPTTRWPSPPAPIARGRRVRIGAGSAVAACAAVVAVVLMIGSRAPLTPSPASAAALLRASAGALQRGRAVPTLGRGDYLYTKTALWWRYRQDEPRPFVVRSVRQSWVARDGSGRDRTSVLSITGLGSIAARRAGFRSDDERRAASLRPFVLLPAPALALSYAQLRALPASPARLSDVVDRMTAAATRSQPRGGLFSSSQWRTAIAFGLARGLAEAPTPQPVRAALYRVLASIPGIQLLGHTTDSAGRPGTAVAATLHALRFTLIIDPATGALLETSRTLVHRDIQAPGLPPGLINRATFLTTAVVRSTHSRPR